jgi:hypothetical protein
MPRNSDSLSKTMKYLNLNTLTASITVSLLAASLFLTGCGKAVLKADYEKIRNGMTKNEVVELLGKPGTQQESEIEGVKMEMMQYQSNDGVGGAKAITITIQNGTVFDKTWTEL